MFTAIADTIMNGLLSVSGWPVYAVVGPCRGLRVTPRVWAVIAGRWVGVLRALVPTVAGMTKMRYRSFAVANAVGGIAWALIVVLLGYTAGASFTHIQARLGRVSLVITSLTVIIALCDVDRVEAPPDSTRRGHPRTPALRGTRRTIPPSAPRTGTSPRRPGRY